MAFFDVPTDAEITADARSARPSASHDGRGTRRAGFTATGARLHFIIGEG